MTKQLTAVALLTLVAGTAMAAPRESRTSAGPVNVWGASMAPESFTLNFTGVDGTPYQATHVQFQATLTSNVAGTWPNDASMDITPPGGAAVTVVLSPVTGTYTTATIDVTRGLSPAVSPAGDWTFTPYETFEDGDGTTPESILTDMTVTLDDTPGAPNGSAATAIDLGTLVDGTNVSAEVNVGSQEVLWYKFTCLDCTNAAGRKLSIGTLNSTNGGDSEIAVYNSGGTGLWANDDWVGLLSFLSFGVGGTTGADLAAGTYYVPVGSYNTTFYIDAFNVVSTGPGGVFQLDVLQEFVGVPTAPTSEDLGTLVDGTTVTRNPSLAAGEVKWYKFVSAAATAGNGRTLSIGTTNGADTTDTEIGLYTDTGALVSANDDNPYPHSLMTWGADGTLGDLAGGQYYLALSTFNANFLANGWNVTSTGAGGDCQLDVAQTVSTGVTVWDETANGGGDAGDGVATTAQMVTGSGPIQRITGAWNGADIDVYVINICDAGAFTASTQFSPNAPDTQLFLFDMSGNGIESDDDNPSGAAGLTSYIDGTFVTSTGNYMLAVTRYDNDATDSGGNEMWADTPYGAIRQPDGPGAAGPLGGWTQLNATAGAYRIDLTGACYASGNTLCSVADVGMAGGVAGHDRLLNNNDFIAFITLFFANDPQADMGMAGGLPGTDGQWNNNDFIAFIGHFFNDAANCNG